MDHQRLLQEISKYPGKTDEEILAILNEPIVRRRKVTTAEVMYEAYNIGLYTKIAAIALDEQQPVELRAFAQSLLSISQNMPDLDTMSQAGETMLAALVQYQLISEEQAKKFRDMGIVSSTSIAKRAGLGEPTVDDLAAARKWQEDEDVLEPLRARLESAYQQAQAKLATVPAPEWSEIVAIFEAA